MAFQRLIMLLVLSIALQGPVQAVADTPPSARDVVMLTTEKLLLALQEQKETIKQDMAMAYNLADATVLPYLDFPRITRWVAGKYWRSASPDQQRRLTEEFQKLLTRSYVTAMVTYADQIVAHANSVQYPLSRFQQDKKNALVTMLIKLESGKDAVVQYQMYLNDNQWKIYDVKVEGVSLAITYRSTFTQEILKGGIDGLIAQLETRNHQADGEPLPGVTAN